MAKLFKKLNQAFMKPLSLLENKYISGGIKLFVILYAAHIAPPLPILVSRLLMNPLIKVGILFLIIYTGIKDPMTSIAIAVSLVLVMIVFRRLERIQYMKKVLDVAVDIPKSVISETQDLVEKGSEKITSVVSDTVEDIRDLAN